ncbi:hypothetical protein A0J48_005935 [Sphaerospermopsis aphanizomenoides BCCUSP55]|uniref:hypothetical protein n=1 Tax=Sphaerospermopsis aphanizomenoides TaxID=459663 RepID=UPI00190399E2|nr:hypothetical protein [Sphaerospermopsis aphanizomenoides]MBK1987080.1 hypothetical protein [Sphaerospermopsis aphanizomenoides BCCUSP55]
MRLPFILDIALGLIFIYLILSLLASEIQELLATVLQWRAVHLRKSIEILLAGDVANSEAKEVIELTNRIYTNPLIKSINQEAKGLLATFPRKLTWFIATLTRSMRKSRSKYSPKQTSFGTQNSAPSYIGADTFATSLIEELQIPKLIYHLTVVRLEKFKEQRLQEVRDILIRLHRNLEITKISNDITQDIGNDFKNLTKEYTDIVNDFKYQKFDIDTTVQRLKDSLYKYVDNFEANIDPEYEFLRETLKRLQTLREHIFSSIDEAITVGGLKPNINEIVQLMNQSSAVYTELKTAIQDENSPTYQTLRELIDSLPPVIVDNIGTIAKRAQYRAKSTEDGIKILRKELENCFDSSMQRAGGVYKRNAKGVAILIGITLAVSANADTFHIIDRLSKDSVLREAIVYKAVQTLENSNSGNPDLNPQEIVNEINLPIGWTKENLQEQLNWEINKIQGWPVFHVLTMISGWIVSGFAIAMGAPFWFDLLSKVMNVRNAGKSPKSANNQDDK